MGEHHTKVYLVTRSLGEHFQIIHFESRNLGTQLPNSQKLLPFTFLGDDVFALTENLMKPLPLRRIKLGKKNFTYVMS